VPELPKVLCVLHQLRRAGAELRTLEVIEAAHAEGWRCDICIDSGEPGELDDRARELGCRLWYIRSGLSFRSRFGALLRSERYGVVHSHVGLTSGAVLRDAHAMGVPVRVAQLHNSRLIRPGVPARIRAGAMRSWIDSHATHIVGVSRGVLENAWSPEWRRDPRCRVVYNGLDVTAFSVPPDREGLRREWGLEPDAPLAVHVGRFHRQKNHAWLLEVFAAMRASRPALRLALIGDASCPEGAEIRRATERLGVADSVVFAGVRPDVPRILTGADLLLLPSLWEGLPGVAVEAYAAGLPVVASDIPGLAEIAERFASVRLVSLAASAEEWAGQAFGALDEGRPETPGWTYWSETPFTVEAASRAAMEIWLSGGGTSGG
jgi:glycosyltransferase involved in cell wall biosynthesis